VEERQALAEELAQAATRIVPGTVTVPMAAEPPPLVLPEYELPEPRSAELREARRLAV
jgi:hypothetical protein